MTWFSESGGSQAQYLQVCKCFSSHSQHQVLVLLPWHPRSYHIKAVFQLQMRFTLMLWACCYYSLKIRPAWAVDRIMAFKHAHWLSHIDIPRLKTVKRFQKHPAIPCSFLFSEPYERFDDFRQKIGGFRFIKTNSSELPRISAVKNHRPPRRSIRPFLPCQQVSVKVVPTRSTTPRKERTSGKSSCEHESKGHQPLHSIKCLLLEF